ncbi:MAG: protein kinase domain-containing protein [Gemmataceae bacterium]
MSSTGTIDNIARFVQVVRDNQLLDVDQLEELAKLQGRFSDPRQLARQVLQLGWMTAYQINQIFQGNGQGLVLGSYILLERLGEGGMGQVFKAHHVHMGRIVALKVIRKAHVANELAVKRFRREIQAAARLSHPNIVAAFDANQVGDTHFFVMEYVDGIDLGKLIRESGPLPVPQACDIIRQAALGLQHAFEKGLVHRDIKPGNLLIAKPTSDGQAVVKILDMGVARLVETNLDDTATHLTQDGKVVGTPDYMAPEQARNSSTIDIRADLYSLGCTLFFTLTGKVVFSGGTAMEKLLRHQTDPPPAIETLRSDLPPALGLILRRLLAKKPEQRYQTPAELAAALEPFCGQVPMAVVVPNVAEAAPLAVFADLETAVVSVETTPQARPPAPSQPTASPVSARARYQAQKRRQVWLTGGALLALCVVASVAWLAISLTQNEPPPNPTPPVQQRDLPFLDRFGSAQIPASERVARQPRELVAVLGEHRGRNWQPIRTLGYTADGQNIVTVGTDQVIRLWDAQTLHERRVIGEPLLGKAYFHGAISPDGKYVAQAWSDDGVVGYFAGRLRVWDTSTGRERLPLRELTPSIRSLAFSPNSRSLLTIDGRSLGNYYDLETGNPPRRWFSDLPGRSTGSLAFSPDDKLVAMICWQLENLESRTVIHLWDTAEKKYLEPIPLGSRIYAARALTFDSQGQQLAAVSQLGQESIIRVWNPYTGKELYSFDENASVQDLKFTPDGQGLIAASADRGLRWWQLDGGPLSRPVFLRGEHAPLQTLAFSPDGRTVAAGGNDQLIHTWNTLTKKPLNDFQGTIGPIDDLVVTPDHQTVAAISPESNGTKIVKGCRIWNLSPTNSTSHSFRDSQGEITSLALAADKQWLLIGGRFDQVASRGFVQLRDLSGKGRSPLTVASDLSEVRRVAISADGRNMAALTTTGTIKIWNEKRKEIASFTHTPYFNMVDFLAFTPDGNTLAYIVHEIGDDSRLNGVLYWWDVRKEKERTQRLDGSGRIERTMLSPDGNTLVTMSNHGRGGQQSLTIRLWNTATGAPLATLEDDLPHGMNAFAFSPNSQLLAGATTTGQLYIWSLQTNKRQSTMPLPGPAHSLAFASDNRHLFTGNGNGTIYLIRLLSHYLAN